MTSPASADGAPDPRTSLRPSEHPAASALEHSFMPNGCAGSRRQVERRTLRRMAHEPATRASPLASDAAGAAPHRRARPGRGARAAAALQPEARRHAVDRLRRAARWHEAAASSTQPTGCPGPQRRLAGAPPGTELAPPRPAPPRPRPAPPRLRPRLGRPCLGLPRLPHPRRPPRTPRLPRTQHHPARPPSRRIASTTRARRASALRPRSRPSGCRAPPPCCRCPASRARWSSPTRRRCTAAASPRRARPGMRCGRWAPRTMAACRATTRSGANDEARVRPQGSASCAPACGRRAFGPHCVA